MKTTDNITVKVTIEITHAKAYCETTKLFTAVREESGAMTLALMKKTAGTLTSDAIQNIRERVELEIEKEKQAEEDVAAKE